MKHTFTNLLTRLCANTPPCFGKRSSQCALRSKGAQFLFSLLLLLVMSIGNAWGTEYVLFVNTNATAENSADFIVNSTYLKTESTAKVLNDVKYKAYVKFGSGATSVSGQTAGNKSIDYDVKTSQIDITVYALGSAKLKVTKFVEGSDEETQVYESASNLSSSLTRIDVATNLSITASTRLCFMSSGNSNLQIYQIVINEKGTALKVPGEAGYVLDFNKPRVASLSKEIKVDGMTIKVSSDVKYTNTSSASIAKSAVATQYFNFTTPSTPGKLKLTYSSGQMAFNNSASTEGATDITSEEEYTLSGSTEYYLINTSTSKTSTISKIEFVAAAAPSGFTVTYNGSNAGGGTVPTDANSYENGDEVTVLGNLGSLTRTIGGCTAHFLGWSTNINMYGGTHYKAGDKFEITGNTTLYAIWGFNIGYYEEDGTTSVAGMAPTSYIHGQGATLPTASKTGYTGTWYNAWCVNEKDEGGCTSGCGFDAQCITTAISSSDVCDADYLVKWTAKEYTVTLNDNGGNSDGSGSVTLTYNSASHAAITNPTKDGFTFDGWYSEEGGTGTLIIDKTGALQANVENYTGAAGIWIKDAACTLYAKWTENSAPTYSVSAVTSTGNNTYGSVSAASATVAEGSTVLITAEPATGYRVANWAVSGTGASIDPNGASNSNTTTLTMGTANATVTVTFEEIPCPTSGTVFGWTKKTGLSNYGFPQGDYTYTPAEPGDYLASITGGTVQLHVNADNKMRIRSSELNFDSGDAYIHVTSACAFQEGDRINVSSTAYITDLKLTLTTKKPGSSGAKEVGTITQGTPFVIEVNSDNEALDLVGETEFYIWRGDAGANVGTFTITRPEKFDVTYSSEKGSAPSATTASSVTLAEITGVSGWKNTGWKANVATEVGGEAVDANTLIANGSVVTLSAATTFTAQWAELYTITTGSPANGTVAADKASALAGETITLTPTPEDGYKLSAWDVYKTGDATTKVSVTNNQFTMPAYGVTISAEFVESVVLYDYSVMAVPDNKSFTNEEVTADATGKGHTFGSEGNPQLIISGAGWDKKDNIINSFIKFFGGTSSMSVVIPAGRKATVTIKYGSYSTGKYLLVNGTEQTHPIKALDNSITTSNIDTYMPTVELTNQTGTLVLNSNGSGNNIYIAYVDVTLTGNASYGVTYHLNDGAWDGDAGAATYTYGTGIATLATNVTREYYDFAGWYGNEGLTGDAVTSIATSATGDKEFWAAWTPKTYTLTWSWNEGSCSATAGDDYTAGGSVAYGTTLVYPEASTMSKADAAFAGWSSTPATMPAEALTITAQWAPEHAISYKEVKGSDVSAYPTTYVQGVGVASFEPLADVADFHFTGWSPASIGTDATEDVDVTAQWVAAYNVSFSAGEGSGTVPATFQKWSGATVELPGQGSMVAPEGKVFAGWKVNGAGETRAAGYEYTMTAAAVEFVAQWKVVTLLINFDGENYSLNTDKFVITGATLDGTEYTVNSKTFEKNFQFGGTMGSSGAFAGQTWTNKYLAYDVTSNSTEIKVYLYNKNGSNKKFYYQIVYEGASAGSLQTPSIKGQATDQVISISVTAAKGARVLFGVESTDVRICQIEVEENGTALPAFGTNGYEFSIPGRAATTSKVGSFDGFSFKTYNDIKLISGIEYLSLRANNGDEYIRFTIDDNIQLKVTETNAKEFYVCTSTTGGTVDDTKYGGTNGTHNVNLHAGTYNIVPVVSGSSGELKITKLAFATAPGIVTVTFNSNEGSAVAEQELFAGEKAVAPTAPTKEGYRFVEWQLSGSAYDFDDEVSADITLDAVWQKTWTVTFNSDGGSDVAAATVDNGAAVAKPADPVKAGFDFVEWQLSESAYNFASPVTADIELVAVWEVAQTDASLSALSYNGNAIDVNSAVEVENVQTYTVHLQWGSTIDKDLISVTKNAESANVSAIAYDSENKKATFSVTSGNGTVTINYAIQFVIDPKRGTSIIKAVTANNTVTGLIGGTRSTSLANGASKKLDKKEYFGMTLAGDATFQEGDVIIINITAAADLGKFMVYADAERTQLVADQGVVYTKPEAAVPVLCPTGEMMMTLPAAANGKKSLYISREDGNTQWNVTFSSLEVLRDMAPVIKSFKFGDDAATIDEEHKTISIEVPYATDVTALTPTVEAYGNNGATYTPAGETDFSSPVDYVVTDAYNEFSTTYAVTVNVAAPSENADLASLAVEGYSLDFDPAVTSYDIVLNYGATVLPTITYEVADQVSPATAVKAEGGVNGATTITVTPQAGAGYNKVYTINFSVSLTPKYVIYDGSRGMTAFSATSFEDEDTHFAWNIGSGITPSADNVPNTSTYNNVWDGKAYTKMLKGFKPQDAATTQLSITVPENYMAKIRLVGTTNNDESMRTMFISLSASRNPDDALNGYIIGSDNYNASGFVTDFLFAGTYYIGTNDTYRLYELSVTLYPIDYSRDVTQGRYGTICLPNGGIMVGATIFEVAYMTYENAQPYKVFFDEVIDGVMEPGMPYIFLPNENVSSIAVTYTDNANASAGNYNGLYGTLEYMDGEALYGKYIFSNNSIFMSEYSGNWLNANRAYIVLSQVPDYVTPIAPNRRRVSMGVNGTNSATGMEDVQGENVQCTKVLIDGRIYILRGEKMYDATGKLVK